MSNHIFQTCYNLCRLNKSRQEEAAQAGIIPSLVRVIETSSPLKQFALPILCDLASAGKSCRTLLWQHDGLQMYLKLLDDPYFQVSALESIVSWLQDETSRVEDELLKPGPTDSLLSCFVTAKANSFENLLDPFLKMMRLSTSLTISLAKGAFFSRLVDRLTHSKAVVRLNLLRMLRAVCEVHPNRGVWVERYGLDRIVERVSRDDAAVLVRELAREIGPGLKPGLMAKEDGSGSNGAGGGGKGRSVVVAPRKPRRAASETNGVSVSAAPAAATATASKLGNGQGLKMKTGRTKLGDISWSSEFGRMR
jgi:hypothetical protein